LEYYNRWELMCEKMEARRRSGALRIPSLRECLETSAQGDDTLLNLLRKMAYELVDQRFDGAAWLCDSFAQLTNFWMLLYVVHQINHLFATLENAGSRALESFLEALEAVTLENVNAQAILRKVHGAVSRVGLLEAELLFFVASAAILSLVMIPSCGTYSIFLASGGFLLLACLQFLRLRFGEPGARAAGAAAELAALRAELDALVKRELNLRAGLGRRLDIITAERDAREASEEVSVGQERCNSFLV